MQLEDIVTKADLAAFEKRVMAALTATKQKKEGHRYLNTKQAAEYVCKKIGKFRSIVKSGEIAYTRDGRGYVFDIFDLDAYMKANRVMSNDEINSKAFARA